MKQYQINFCCFSITLWNIAVWQNRFITIYSFQDVINFIFAILAFFMDIIVCILILSF